MCTFIWPLCLWTFDVVPKFVWEVLLDPILHRPEFAKGSYGRIFGMSLNNLETSIKTIVSLLTYFLWFLLLACQATSNIRCVECWIESHRQIPIVTLEQFITIFNSFLLYLFCNFEDGQMFGFVFLCDRKRFTEVLSDIRDYDNIADCTKWTNHKQLVLEPNENEALPVHVYLDTCEWRSRIVQREDTGLDGTGKRQGFDTNTQTQRVKPTETGDQHSPSCSRAEVTWNVPHMHNEMVS